MPTLISETSPFPILGVLGGIFHFVPQIIIANGGDPNHMPLTISHYSIYTFVENWLKVKNAVSLKKYFFSIKLLHAHLQYICNIPAKYQKDTLSTLGGIDFTRYEL